MLLTCTRQGRPVGREMLSVSALSIRDSAKPECQRFHFSTSAPFRSRCILSLSTKRRKKAPEMSARERGLSLSAPFHVSASQLSFIKIENSADIYLSDHELFSPDSFAPSFLPFYCTLFPNGFTDLFVTLLTLQLAFQKLKSRF